MIEQDCFKRLTLRAVLRHVSPMVIRLISVSDRMDLSDFNDIFCAVVGWSGNMGYVLRIHGQEFNSFRRKTRAKSLREFRLHRQEKFLYVCDPLNRWEWDVQVLDIEDGIERGDTPVCLGGRGATPPEFCGGPTGYRLMLKRQREGSAMLEPKMVEAGIQMLTESSPDTPAGIWNLLHTAVDECLHSLDLRLKRVWPIATGPVQIAGSQRAVGSLDATTVQVPGMNLRIELVGVSADGSEQRRQMLSIERQELAMETLGMSVAESKALLEGVQDFMIAQQVGEDLERRRACSHCGRRHAIKDFGTASVKTLFGSVSVSNPRWHRCSCQTEGPKTFRPTHAWLQGTISAEMLYMETKWASLIPFAKVADLLKEVLPVGDSVHGETVRKHMQAVAERIEQELGEERQLNQYEGSENEWEQQPLPDGPITVGIDGGYVRAAHKQGCFEVIAGKSVVAFRREDETEIASAKCFGFVQTYDGKPRRRLWELLKSQGMQENQQVVFMSDGGEDVRRVQQYLHPFSEHLLDWFHITMRLTVLQQQTKGLQQERPATYAGIAKQLESIKHFLWHGNTPEAMERLTGLSIHLSMIREHSAPAAKIAHGVADFETYIKNNSEFIPNFGDRWRQGERISTAFVESTINQVVSRRFVKKQQMQWTLRGAHLLLQTRTKVLNNELEGTFRQWYPKFRPKAA